VGSTKGGVAGHEQRQLYTGTTSTTGTTNNHRQPLATQKRRGKKMMKEDEMNGNSTEGQPRMQIQANKIIIQIFGMSHER